MANPQPIFLISLQRSGTNLLRGLLDGHPEIAANFGEPFEMAYDNRWDYYEYAWQATRENKDLFLPNKANNKTLLEGFLNYMQDQAQGASPVIDIKYNSIHLMTPAWWESHNIPFLCQHISDQKYPVIHLIRENLLAVYCSRILSENNQQFTVFVDKKDEKNTLQKTLKVEPRSALFWIRERDREIQNYRRIFNRHQGPAVEVMYEDLLTEGMFSADVRSRLAKTLGIDDSFGANPRTVKQGKKSLADIIENYDEVRETFQSSEFYELVA